MRLHIGGVHDAETSGTQPLGGNIVQHVERVAGCGLVVFVVGDHRPERVTGQYLRGAEMAPGERRLTRPGDADQHDQRQLGNVDNGHFATSLVNRASWVGVPSSGSSSPTPRRDTV